MKKIKIIVLSLSTVMIGAMLITDSKGIADTVRRCTETCLDSLIPSLFCFMLFASAVIGSGVGEVITAPLWIIFRYVIKLNRNMLAVFIISQFGGYPIGVKLLNELIRKDQRYNEQAKQAIYYCFSSGPAFVVGIVGIGIYNDVNAGIIIFISCLAANLIAAIIMNIKNKTPQFEKLSVSLKPIRINEYLKDCINSLIKIVSLILLFNSAAELIKFILSQLFNISIPYIISTAIEITNIKQASIIPSVILSAGLVSFGGLCVIYQIVSLAEFKIGLIKLIAARIVISLLSAFICKIIIKISGYSPSLSVFAYKYDVTATSPVISVCIMCMTVIILSEAGKLRKL
ncbi:MAG: hypothetical protein ACI4JI_09135 [Ruminiclostridium sp.]